MTLDRKGGWIQTYTGKHIYPLDSRPEEIDIEDIAHSLSNLCRFNGQCLRFYSVAEHSVLVSRFASNSNKLVALMHDASEAYLADIPRPLKKNLSGYVESEEVLMSAIGNKFGFDWPMPDEVKLLDNRILYDEAYQNMAPITKTWHDPYEPLGVKLEFWTPTEAKNHFLESFSQYSPSGKAHLSRGS